METREQRGAEIAKNAKIEAIGKLWIVPSQSGNGKYLVDRADVPHDGIRRMTGDLTETEQNHVRAALRILHVRFGRWRTLSKALRTEDCYLTKVVGGRRIVSASLAFRTARLIDISIDDLLAGAYPPPGTCPYCGHCAEDAENVAGDVAVSD